VIQPIPATGSSNSSKEASEMAWGDRFGQPPAGVGPAGPVTAAGLGKAGATGIRGSVESVLGIAGDIPRLAGRAGRWASGKTGLGDPEQVGAAVERNVQGVINPATKIIRALQLAGVIDADTAEKIIAVQAPGSQEIGAATDWMVKQLPESVSGPIQDIARHQAANPAERFAETAGGFAGTAFLPGGAISRVARPFVAAAGTEAAGAAVPEEYEDVARLVAGMVLGGGKAGVERGFRERSALRVVGTTPAAANRVKQLLIDQGMTPQEATARMKEFGSEATLMDVGPITRQEAQQIHATPGPGRGIIDPMLRERERGANRRLEADVTMAVGPELRRTDVLQALKDRAAALSPEYKAAHAAQTKPVATQSILDEIDSDLAVVKSPETEAALKRIRKSLFLRDTEQLDPSSEGLHEARKAIDNVLYDSQGRPRDVGGDTARRLGDYRKQIDEALGEAGPIKEVDVKRAQIGKEERAFTKGEEVYETPRGSPSAVEFQRTWDAMTPGERGHVLSGVNVETWRQLNISANDRVKLQNLLKGEGKLTQQRLASVVGEDKAQALMNALGREKTFQETYNKVVQGSKTGETVSRKGGIVQAAMQALPEIAAVGAAGGPWAALTSAGSNARRIGWDVLSRRGATSRDAEMAKLLTSQRPDDIARAMQIMQERGSVLPPAIVTALLARQQDTARRKEDQP
jgi:hypothetical protein